ncbi:MAG: glycerate kinase, partial [Chloroflexi bacterium]|nr:glycerate kinase [Chloroflexota bacterium]
AALLAFADAKLRSGADLVMSATRFDERARASDLVVTGEGRVDAQSGYGKVTGAVVERAKALGKPVAIIAGGVAPGYEVLFRSGLAALEVASEGVASLEEAMRQGEALISSAAERLARSDALARALPFRPS